jgi:hypothetical protein
MKLEADARTGLYRLYFNKQCELKPEGYRWAYLSQEMREEQLK